MTKEQIDEKMKAMSQAQDAHMADRTQNEFVTRYLIRPYIKDGSNANDFKTFIVTSFTDDPSKSELLGFALRSTLEKLQQGQVKACPIKMKKAK